MKSIRWIILLFLAAAVSAAVIRWKRSERLALENRALQAEINDLREQNIAAGTEAVEQLEREVQRLRAETQELQRLRNEVSQLRSTSKEAEKLPIENQQLRTAAAHSTAPPTAPPAAPTAQSSDQFPRESWSFAGYATPEAALVSAIWAMREGNPKTYLDSLSPAEQLRMAKVWENKSETEIAAKHQQDVAAISGVRVLERQSVSPDEVLMSVYVEGVRRMEVVSMKLVGNEWKFGGFKRDTPK